MIQQIVVESDASLDIAGGSVNVWHDTKNRFLIDTGYPNFPTEKLKLSEIQELLITHDHPDHSGGLDTIVAAGFDGTIFAPVTYEHQVLKIQALSENLQALESPLQIFHTPGHTHEHYCFYNPQTGDFFAGDLIVGGGTAWIGPPDGNFTEYIASLDRVIEIAPKTIYPGHGQALNLDYVHWTKQHKLQRVHQVQSILQAQPMGSEQLVEHIYVQLEGRQFAPAGYYAAVETMKMYLEYLVLHGEIVEEGGIYHCG